MSFTDVTRRHVLALTAALPLLATRAARAESLPRVAWSRDPKDPRWVQGQAIVAAAPDAVWARIQRVDAWPTLFSDIKWLKVLERSPTHWGIRLESKSMTCGAHDYHIRFSDPRTGQVIIDAPGTTSLAYFRVLEGRTSDEARAVYSLFIEVRGIMSWFVSETALREKQEQMVERYLRDIDRVFNAPRASRT